MMAWSTKGLSKRGNVRAVLGQPMTCPRTRKMWKRDSSSPLSLDGKDGKSWV